jgi:hypothetical protein
MSIRKLPALDERIETGPVQFGDDWPGVFIRGDNALWFAKCLEVALAELPGYTMTKSVLYGLASDLRSCSAGDTGWPP